MKKPAALFLIKLLVLIKILAASTAFAGGGDVGSAERSALKCNASVNGENIALTYHTYVSKGLTPEGFSTDGIYFASAGNIYFAAQKKPSADGSSQIRLGIKEPLAVTASDAKSLEGGEYSVGANGMTLNCKVNTPAQ